MKTLIPSRILGVRFIVAAYNPLLPDRVYFIYVCDKVFNNYYDVSSDDNLYQKNTISIAKICLQRGDDVTSTIYILNYDVINV